MAGTRGTDRRIQKTQTLLRAALASLIREKDYDSIAVKEILDRANVGRSTFYMHFRDKDDLLVSGIHDMLSSVHSTGLPSSAARHDKLTSFSLPIFEYHEAHRHTGKDRMGTRGRAIVTITFDACSRNSWRRKSADRIGGREKRGAAFRRLFSSSTSRPRSFSC